MALSAHTKWLRLWNFLFGIVILILSGSAFTRICSPPDHIFRIFHVEVISNWKRLSIYDLHTVSSTDSCPFGYEGITRATEWPGTYEGCFCAATGEVIEGACTTDQTTKGCVLIPATISFSMHVWRGRTLCIKRAGTSVYWAPKPDSSTCPSKKDVHGNTVEFTKCGTGDVAVCQEASIGCPINRIKIQNSTEPSPSGYARYIYFGGGYNLYFDYGNSTSTEAPIIDFGISEGSICLQNAGDEGTKTKSYYSLLKKSPSGCKYTDGRFEVLDQVDEVTFYQNNDLQNIVSLPELDLDPSIIYYFSLRRSILWKEVCHEHYYSMSTLYDNKDPLKYILNLHIALLVVQCIFATYLMIVDPILLYCLYKRSEEEINEYDQPIYSVLVFEKILKLIMIPVLLTVCVIVGYYRNWFYNLEERCCSDPVTNECFGFVDYVLNDLYGLDWANFSVVVVVLIVDMISGLCLFVSRTKENYTA